MPGNAVNNARPPFKRAAADIAVYATVIAARARYRPQSQRQRRAVFRQTLRRQTPARRRHRHRAAAGFIHPHYLRRRQHKLRRLRRHAHIAPDPRAVRIRRRNLQNNLADKLRLMLNNAPVLADIKNTERRMRLHRITIRRRAARSRHREPAAHAVRMKHRHLADNAKTQTAHYLRPHRAPNVRYVRVFKVHAYHRPRQLRALAR